MTCLLAPLAKLWRYALIAAIMFLVIPDRMREAHSTPPSAMKMLPIDAPLSVMTFNVEGLAWPVRFGRAASLERIGDRLAQMRADHRQPRIVLLQEVFSEDARDIARLSGYRFVATGPARDMAGSDIVSASDRRFVEDRSMWKGETGTKLADSGLQILSDYPIVGIRRVAFADHACAGFDCLANKGVLLAYIAVPGEARPVAVAVTHLNSRTASGVKLERSMYAYRRQVDTLEAFLKDQVRPGMKLIVGGDFNVGDDKAREAYLTASVARWPRHDAAADAAVLKRCAGESGCAATMADDARATMERNKDLQFAATAQDGRLTPARVVVPFGREADGTSLSDHMGYVVYYRWGRS